MRTPIIAGNWKMFKTTAEASELVKDLKEQLDTLGGVDKVVCPPFTALQTVAELTRGSSIGVGGQDMYWEEQGAFTGEVSPLMMKELAQYVIIGHSERRQHFGETDETVNRKVKAALAHELMPIVCVGENLAQNEAGETKAVVTAQVRAAVQGLSADQAKGLVFAYEPIWAIGTGKAATSEGAETVIRDYVRGTLAELYDSTTADAVRIQYGGSVNPDNIGEFMSLPDIDGALVGGASLSAAKFVPIVRVAAQVKSGGKA